LPAPEKRGTSGRLVHWFRHLAIGRTPTLQSAGAQFHLGSGRGGASSVPASSPLWTAALPILALFWTLCFGGFVTALELNPDEGINLIKAALLTEGYPLYTSTWSDQPPLLTHALSVVITLFGRSVAVPRVLMLLASTAFVWGIGRHLQRSCGLVHALAAQALILAQPAFYLYGGAVMVGLPALYLAFASVFALLRARATGRPRWIVASALLLAASMLTKLFTVVVVPALLLLVLWVAAAKDRTVRPWIAVPLWTATLLSSFGALFLLLIGVEDAGQLVFGHAQALTDSDSGLWSGQTLWLHLSRLPWLLTPTVIGGAFALQRRDPVLLFFVGWTATAAVALSLHSPVWSHQQFLITLPAAVVGGYGVGETLAWLRRRSKSDPSTGSPPQDSLAEQHGPLDTSAGLGRAAMLVTAMVFVAFVQFGNRQAPERRGFEVSANEPAISGLLRDLERRGRDERLMITDRPMLAYRAGLVAPPWIAALTEKRMKTGQLSDEDLVAEIRNHAPVQVLLGRFQVPKTRALLDRTYQPSQDHPQGKLYLRDDEFLHSAVTAAANEWSMAPHRPASWYTSGEARVLLATLLTSQGPNGGWPKLSSASEAAATTVHRKDEADETLDNRSTTSQLGFLSRMIAIEDEPVSRESLRRGVDYLLASQYPTGCWPQNFPHAFSYHAHCTLNDGVTVNAAGFLQAALLEKPRVSLADLSTRVRATQAVARAVDFFVRAQVRVGGRLTGWCQQHDPLTLEPRPARTFEPVALASRETADVLRFLMQQPDPSAAVKEAVRGGVAWLESVKIAGLRIEERRAPELPRGRERITVADADAPPVWARLYSIESGQPLYVGRDGNPRATFNDIEAERRAGYEFLVHDPATVLNEEYPKWCRRNGCVAEPGSREEAPVGG
jgi:PelA/Pel-15E family pectate lyase